MPKRTIVIYLALYAVAFAALAKILPWAIFIPIAFAMTFLHASLIYRKKKNRYIWLMNHVKNIQSDTLPSLEYPGNNKDIDEHFYESFKEIAAELEKKCYQLVEKNIQLLSMKELGLTIISSMDEKKVVDSVKNYLSKGLGFKEFFISIFEDERIIFKLYSYRDAFGRIEQKRVSLKLSDIGGLLHKALVTRRALIIRDPEMHPIGTLDGEALFKDSTMSGFVLVPLLKSTISTECWLSKDCTLNRENLDDADQFELIEYKCPACDRFPILGIIGVTDGFKAEGLSQVDLVSVETLALQVSTILENTHLYNELKNEEIFRDNVINSMMNGLVTVDTEGKIMLVNQTAENLSGYSTDELVGKHVDELIVEGGSATSDGFLMSTLRMGRRIFQKEVWLTKKDGGKLPIVLNTSFLLGEDKTVQGILAVFYDLTQIKLMEKKIMHLDKLAALGRFSSSIAHEIRNPLTGIATGIQYLKRTSIASEEELENITFILNEVGRIDRLIGDLMSVVKVGDLIYQKTLMEAVIKNSITSLKELIGMRGIKIKTQFHSEKKEIQIDPDRITQVMINLLKNSIEASSQGGEIVIEVSFPRDVKDVLFDGVGDYAMIKIIDRGVGLTPDEKEKIFEPFFSTKQDGIGLGLYVAHSLIERHGGSILVESELGKGSTFSIFLPAERARHGESN